MGKYMHKGHGRNISVGGGYAKQERKDLFKDMSGSYNAMGDSNSPNYRYDGNAVAQKYGAPIDMSQAQANNLPPELVKAIKKDEEKGGKKMKIKQTERFKS